MDMRGVSREVSSTGEDDNAVRVLNGKAILSHYAHLRSQPGRTDKRCAFCQSGLDGVIKEVEVQKPEVDVVPSDRVDKEGDTTSAPDRRGSWGSEG